MTRDERAAFKAAGFTSHEGDVIRACFYAHQWVSNGHFLPSDGRQKAARALIERGVLTHAGDFPFFGCEPMVVVMITQEQWTAVHKMMWDAMGVTE